MKLELPGLKLVKKLYENLAAECGETLGTQALLVESIREAVLKSRFLLPGPENP